jgi:3D (Asp-Asp-Asp) domain-containing protein
LPKYEAPLTKAQFQSVRTTAYTHTEGDHLRHGRSSAMGTTLQSGPVQSAAADWSRWPAGTLFRLVETGELYEVDDYGWALSGTNTIDLYKPTRAAMNAWGVRRVTIENLRWGDPHRSLAVLRPRAKYRHVARMIREFRTNDMTFPPLTPTTSEVQVAQATASPAPAPRVVAGLVPEPPRAIAVKTVPPRSAPTMQSAAVIKPFYHAQ